MTFSMEPSLHGDSPMIQFGFPIAITFVIFWKENELEIRPMLSDFLSFSFDRDG